MFQEMASDSITAISSQVAAQVEVERVKFSGSAPDQEPPLESDLWETPLDLPSLFGVTPPPIKWFIKDRLIAGRGAVVSGIGGSSKSRLNFHLAVGAVLGRLSWNWEVVTTGRALLVMTEDTATEFHRTIHFLCESMNLSPNDKRKVYAGIVAYPLAGEDVILLQKIQKNILENTPLFEALVQKIQELDDIVFVALDPALSLTTGDELDQGHQRRLGKMCDNLGVLTGATVMLVAHAPKNPKEEIGSHNSRGGGALVDAVRTEFVLRAMTRKEALNMKIADPQERFRHVQLVATKGNFLPPSAYLPVWLRRDDYGMLHGVDISFNDADVGPTKNDLEALKILTELCQGATPRLIEWREALIEKKIIGDAIAKTQEVAMERIKKRLYDHGLIKSLMRGFWVPEQNGKDIFDFNDD